MGNEFKEDEPRNTRMKIEEKLNHRCTQINADDKRDKRKTYDGMIQK